MSSYNEADVLGESIDALIREGVDVYLLDNCSTDNSLETAERYRGKGLVGIEKILFKENGKEVYNWAGILRRKEEIAKELDHDWFIHVDADEVRLSPWHELTLKEAIRRVDSEGYNLINFKLFNFRLHEAVADAGPVESRLAHYSSAESFNAMQIKAWKACDQVDLVSSGGHFARVVAPKVSPYRFILKHYPIRTLEQGVRKINAERKARFTVTEKSRNWHRQYDELSQDENALLGQLVWKMSELKFFDIMSERKSIQEEARKILEISNDVRHWMGYDRMPTAWAQWMSEKSGASIEEATLLVDLVSELLTLNDCLVVDSTAKECLSHEAYKMVMTCIAKESALQFLEGKPGLAELFLLA